MISERVQDLVKLIPLTVHTDDRGYLYEVIREDTLCLDVRQVYIVGNHAGGTVRGFHKHTKMYDWFHIATGAAKFIFWKPVDGGKYIYQIVTISDKNPTVIEVPPTVYHGWVGLTDSTVLVSMASECYNKEDPDEVRVPYTALDDIVPHAWDVEYK